MSFEIKEINECVLIINTETPFLHFPSIHQMMHLSIGFIFDPAGQFQALAK